METVCWLKSHATQCIREWIYQAAGWCMHNGGGIKGQRSNWFTKHTLRSQSLGYNIISVAVAFGRWALVSDNPHISYFLIEMRLGLCRGEIIMRTLPCAINLTTRSLVIEQPCNMYFVKKRTAQRSIHSNPNRFAQVILAALWVKVLLP